MDLRNIYLSTLIAEWPRIYNYNNQVIKNYLDVIYDEASGIVVVPVNTSGKIKGATGEFVTLIADNLIVRNQYTNLYNNITTADYQYYTTYIGADASYRDASITSGENNSFKYIDVNMPYYKINNTVDYAFKTSTLSQVVEVIFDVSTADAFIIRLNSTQSLSITAANAAINKGIQLICVGLPGISASDNTWAVKQGSGFTIV